MNNLVSIFLVFLCLLAHSSPAQSEKEVREYVLELVQRSTVEVYDSPSTSLKLSSEALTLAKQLKDDSLKALALNRVGNAHWSLGNVIEALDYIQQSLQIAELMQYRELIANDYGSIGKVYATAGFDLDAIGYYRLELSIVEALPDKFRLFNTYNNLGSAFLRMEEYDSAWKYLTEAENHLDPSFIHLHAIFYLNLAEMYFNQQYFKKSDSLLQISLESAKGFNFKRGIIQANRLKAELERRLGNNQTALAYARVAANLADECKVKELIYLSYKTLSNCYGDLEEYEKAYQYNQLYETYLDSVQSVAAMNELTLLSYYQRLFRVRVLEEKSTVISQLAEKRMLIIYSLVGILLLAIFMISVIVRRGRKINRQAKKLQELDAFKNKVFAIVSHDLQSPIKSVSAAIEMFHDKMISKEELEENLPEIRRMTSHLIDLLKNIFQWAEGHINNSALEQEEFDVVHTVMSLEMELEERLVEKKIDLVYAKNASFKLFSNPGIVRIVLRNLLVNAIKFSHEGSTIRLNFTAIHGQKFIEVSDEGIGMTKDVLSNLFSMEMGSRDGTNGEKGNGLGLALCFDFIRVLGGKIEADSKPGEGSTFKIYFTNQPG